MQITAESWIRLRSIAFYYETHLMVQKTELHDNCQFRERFGRVSSTFIERAYATRDGMFGIELQVHLNVHFFESIKRARKSSAVRLMIQLIWWLNRYMSQDTYRDTSIRYDTI